MVYESLSCTLKGYEARSESFPQYEIVNSDASTIVCKVAAAIVLLLLKRGVVE